MAAMGSFPVVLAGQGAAKIRPPLFGGRRQGHLAVFVRTSYSKPLFRRTRRTLPKESAMTKTYAEINEKIASGKAVVLTAEEVIDYVDRRGLEAAARELALATTGTGGLHTRRGRSWRCTRCGCGCYGAGNGRRYWRCRRIGADANRLIFKQAHEVGSIPDRDFELVKVGLLHVNHEFVAANV